MGWWCHWLTCRAARHRRRCHAGGVVGDYLGGFVADLYSKWNEPKDQTPPPEQKVSANASLRVELADGLRITSTTVNEDGMGMDVFTGNNFLAW